MLSRYVGASTKQFNVKRHLPCIRSYAEAFETFYATNMFSIRTIPRYEFRSSGINPISTFQHPLGLLSTKALRTIKSLTLECRLRVTEPLEPWDENALTTQHDAAFIWDALEDLHNLQSLKLDVHTLFEPYLPLEKWVHAFPLILPSHGVNPKLMRLDLQSYLHEIEARAIIEDTACIQRMEADLSTCSALGWKYVEHSLLNTGKVGILNTWFQRM